MITSASIERMQALRHHLADPCFWAQSWEGSLRADQDIVEALVAPEQAEGYRRTGILRGHGVGDHPFTGFLADFDAPMTLLSELLPDWGYGLHAPRVAMKVTSQESGGVEGWAIRPQFECVLSRHDRLRSDKGPHEVWIGKSKIDMARAIIDAICDVGINSKFDNTALGEHE